MPENDSQQMNDRIDHIMAALSHATALIPMVGVIAPIVIWVTQKDKSEYVAFQGLQAIVYQFVMIIAYFFGMALYILSTFLMMVIMAFSAGHFQEVVVIIPFVVLIGIFVFGGLLILYGVIAAVMTAMGKDFQYILIGNWVKKYTIKQNSITA